MHGAPVTLHVTSPTSRLFSMIVRVVVMRPLISSAETTRVGNRSAAATRLTYVQYLAVRMARFYFTGGVIHQTPLRAAESFHRIRDAGCRTVARQDGLDRHGPRGLNADRRSASVGARSEEMRGAYDSSSPGRVRWGDGGRAGRYADSTAGRGPASTGAAACCLA